MGVVAIERELYGDLWSLQQYAEAHSPGAERLPVFLEMAGIPDDRSMPGYVLDAGCGAGKGALALAARGFVVTCCDITADGLLPEIRDSLTIRFHEAVLWDDLAAVAGAGDFDYGYCCDVMEHIPPQFTMLAAARLLSVVRRGVYFAICFEPDVMGAWVGKSLHQTVQPFTWWRDSLAAVGRVAEARDHLAYGSFWVTPR